MAAPTASHGPARPRTVRHDPALRTRLGGLLAAVVVAWPMLVLADFRPWALFDAQGLQAMRAFLLGFWPLATDAVFLRLLARATLETLAMATAGTFVAFVIATPLALVVTRALSVSRIGPGPGVWRAAVGRQSARLLLTVLRAVPEVVWALVLVRALGLGPGAGVLAIGIAYGGMLGKVYSEILESGDTRPARALLEAGSARLPALCYGLVPGAAQELASYTVYRWECAVRASVVMGFVGAGGLGQLMDQSMKMLNGGEASVILESGDTRPARALLEAGSARLPALCYGLVPGAAQELASYTVYRWECAVRASVVMGFVGAGGLGQLMDQSMKMLNGGEASVILLSFLALVLLADALSALLRRVLE